MNDGFIALWLMTMAAILYFTGWEQAVADRLPIRVIGTFLAVACALQFIRLSLMDDIAATGSAVFILGTAIVLLFSIRQPGSMLFVLFSALLTGFMWTWMSYIYAMDPVFVIIHPRWDGPVLAGLFAGLLADRFRSHMTIVVLSGFIALSSRYLGPAAPSSPLLIGTLAWWDGIAIALTAARIMSSFKIWVKERTLGFVERRSGEEGGRS
ncbi:YphA family membrane protein [Paenibacillus sacheonensis]|uniref:Uncharacterized protein n=1 Tax=Paenibacillus sacheonensis TaxID=742054 RepID=A0A7X4YP67_9BACL|nr:hypothetical protein [Paenibacillus sacheonensis]MBM7564469.1 hypothetical protein [Paenibacillus sacheonensis]NBC69029.1 hypothetical protein [Paenibacillus sacheonensis]